MTPAITDVETFYLRLPEVRERTDSSQDALLVRVRTDAGVDGWGEVDSVPLVAKAVIEAPTSHARAHGLRELLIGRNPLETDRLWDLMYESTLYIGREGAVIQAMAGIDLALWDIKGKLLDQPVHALLGGAYQTRLRAYASHMFDFDPAVTARRAGEARDAGYTAVKFGWEPMGPDPALDETLVRGIREAVGDDVDVCIDAGLAWDAKTAIERCAMFEPYRLCWLEEPLHPDDLRGYRTLTSRVDTRIAAGEEECTTAGFLRLMDVGAIDVVQIDVTRVGLTQARRIARLAAERGIPCANHNFTTDINVAASAHFLASVPNAIMLEYCVEPSPIRTQITRNPIPVVDGHVAVPDGPGLGIEVDPAGIERFLVTA
ncbi:MAG: mandelate racemase/muconate lactonizing enzyme family protein [Streptosporangiales bacterium]|nr:mandelate racemase/muconate lactonizing enzyme family protein [Streptosporangiales bacterium]